MAIKRVTASFVYTLESAPIRNGLNMMIVTAGLYGSGSVMARSMSPKAHLFPVLSMPIAMSSCRICMGNSARGPEWPVSLTR